MPAQEKIRVLIVDDITETRENIRRLLQFDTTIEVVGSARSGKEAIDLTNQLKPDVIIMDINMPDMDGITATELIRKKVPFAQVVILSVQSDASYMRRAMLAGARDFLSKPPSIDDLTAAIHRAGVMAIEERAKSAQAHPASSSSSSMPGGSSIPVSGKIVVVYSPKGGAGTTTIATNLALALKNDESNVLLVDGNVQFGDIAVFLNEHVKNSLLDLTPRVEELDQDVVKEVVITHAASGVQFIAAPTRPEMAEKVNSDQFGKLLAYLRHAYSFIVVDTASYLTDIVQAALEIADLIVLITTQDIPSIKNANAFMNLTDASGIKRDRIIFIMNRYDKKFGISPERVSESLRQPILATVPYDDKGLVSNAINRGVPLLLENKTPLINKNILSLAEIIREKAMGLDGYEPITKK